MTPPANDNAHTLAQPITIGSANCVAVTGMSWKWVTRFAQAHGVPVWRVGSRKQLIPAAPLAEAMARAAAEAQPLTFHDEVEAFVAGVAARMRR